MSLSSRVSTHSNVEFPPGRLLVAFSGGEDSLYLLSIVPKERAFPVYVNHNLRTKDELDREIDLNRKNAEALGFSLTVVDIRKGMIEEVAKRERIGIEAAARKLRYEALSSFDCSYILTAHHQDDLVEGFLMRIMDGSPLSRLSSIRYTNGRILRPLLYLKKSEIKSGVKKLGLTPSIDSTNCEKKYRRNAIRYNLLPLLSQNEKDIITNISRNIEEYNSRIHDIPYEVGTYITFSRLLFLNANPTEMENLIYKIYLYSGIKGRVSRKEIKRCTESILEGRKFQDSHLFLFIRGDLCSVYFPIPMFAFQFCSSLKFLGYKIERGSLLDEKDLRIDFSLVKKPLILRPSLPLDQIELKDGKKSVRELERELKIPYSFVLEDRIGIIAFFSRALGGRDRLSRRFLEKGGERVILTQNEILSTNELH